MRSLALRSCLVVLCLALLPGLTLAQAKSNLAEVTVTGQGMDKTEALRDAQRKAVEQAAGTLLYSQSETKDFVLAKDTVLARAAGFVQEYKVLSQSESADGVVELKIRAIVSKQGIEDTWGVVTNLLQQMGRPKIMVFLRERIGEEVQDTSTVQTRIENMLLKNGFQLVDRSQIKAIEQKNLASAVAEDNPARVQAIAKQFGAQIFITGEVNAAPPQKKTIYGRTTFITEAESNIKVFRSDTGQLMAAIPGRATRGAQNIARSAAKQALDSQGQFIAPRVTQDILRFWMDALEGRGEVILKVDNVSFKDYLTIKKALSKIKGVKDVQKQTFANKVVDISVQADMNAEALAEKIVMEHEDLMEITDVSQNVIKGTFRK